MKSSLLPLPITTYAPRHYFCKRTTMPLDIDGNLDKPFWHNAPFTDDFVDIEGDCRPIPQKRTRVKMLWDDQFLYIGAYMEENQIFATLTERDSVIFQDNDFEVFIDPDGDTHAYYEIEINALNTVWDLLLIKPYRDGGPPVNGWDIRGLKTAVHLNGKLNDPQAENRGWSVEIALPFASLRECDRNHSNPRPGDIWRINFSRVNWQLESTESGYQKKIDPSTNQPFPEDNYVWSPMGIINMHYPELWGYLIYVDSFIPSNFSLSIDEKVKWELRKWYYALRNFYAIHGYYFSHPSSYAKQIHSEIEPRIEITTKTFLLSYPISNHYMIYLNEEGRVWFE